MSGSIVINSNGVNSYLVSRPISRLYCGYGDNTTETGGVQNTWYEFGYPSTGITTYRSQDFTVAPAAVQFTYTGTSPKWFRVSATCNVKKASGGGGSRTIEFQWYLNGSPAGGVRQSHMNRDSEVVTGCGQIFLSAGDVISPHFRNIENGESALMFNCQFDIVEDHDNSFFP